MSELASKTVTDDRGFDRVPVIVCEARSSSGYWFIMDGHNGLETVIEFDRVTFDRRDDGTIRTIHFFRTDDRRPPTETASLEGGRADWGDEIVDALEAINDD